jgi:hypothetical protein
MRIRLLLALAVSVAACSGGDRPYVPAIDAPDIIDDFTDARPPIDAPEAIDAPERIDAPRPIDAAVDAPTPTALRVAVVGQGLVVSAPAGIRCQPTCEARFPPGTVVTLTAIPSAGWRFVGWSGDCTGASCSLPGAGVVTATFESTTTTGCVLGVELQGPGRGSVVSSPAGINCGPDCRETYPCGTGVILTALPAPGSVFTGWTGGSCTGTGTCIVSVTQPFQAVIATFR